MICLIRWQGRRFTNHDQMADEKNTKARGDVRRKPASN